MDDSSIVRASNKTAEISTSEREILKLSAQGKSIEEIAVLLHSPPARVREHIRSATLKLGARTYTHAVVTAVRECELSISEAQLNSIELSDKEREVLWLSAQGNSMEEIAATLRVSVARVRELGRTATLKLGARTYTQAVVAALQTSTAAPTSNGWRRRSPGRPSTSSRSRP